MVCIAISRLPSTGIAPATMFVPPRSTPTINFSFALIRAPVDEEPAGANSRCTPPTTHACTASDRADSAAVRGDHRAGTTNQCDRLRRDAQREDQTRTPEQS